MGDTGKDKLNPEYPKRDPQVHINREVFEYWKERQSLGEGNSECTVASFVEELELSKKWAQPQSNELGGCSLCNFPGDDDDDDKVDAVIAFECGTEPYGLCKSCADKSFRLQFPFFQPIRCPLENKGCNIRFHKPIITAKQFRKIFGKVYPGKTEEYEKLMETTMMCDTFHKKVELMKQGKWTTIWKAKNEAVRDNMKIHRKCQDCWADVPVGQQNCPECGKAEIVQGDSRESVKTCPKCDTVAFYDSDACYRTTCEKCKTFVFCWICGIDVKDHAGGGDRQHNRWRDNDPSFRNKAKCIDLYESLRQKLILLKTRNASRKTLEMVKATSLIENQIKTNKETSFPTDNKDPLVANGNKKRLLEARLEHLARWVQKSEHVGDAMYQEAAKEMKAKLTDSLTLVDEVSRNILKQRREKKDKETVLAEMKSLDFSVNDKDDPLVAKENEKRLLKADLEHLTRWVKTEGIGCWEAVRDVKGQLRRDIRRVDEEARNIEMEREFKQSDIHEREWVSCRRSGKWYPAQVTRVEPRSEKPIQIEWEDQRGKVHWCSLENVEKYPITHGAFKKGDRVTLGDLLSPASLNGLTGTLDHWNPDKGNNGQWLFVFMAKDNDHYQGFGGYASSMIFTAHWAVFDSVESAKAKTRQDLWGRAPALTDTHGTFKKGDLIELRGLITDESQHLNGQKGTLEYWNPDLERWRIIRLTNSNTDIDVKEVNISLAR